MLRIRHLGSSEGPLREGKKKLLKYNLFKYLFLFSSALWLGWILVTARRIFSV